MTTLGCGSGMDASHFTVEPEAPVLAVGEQVSLAARPNLDLAGEPDWEVQEQYGGGLLRSQGPTTVYVAPETAGTYHLILRGPRRDGKTVKQTVEIRVLPLLTIEPATARISAGASTTFNLRVKGMAREQGRWSVEAANGGEINEDGRYTAPARAGAYHVLFSSKADPTVAARATVLVTD